MTEDLRVEGNSEQIEIASQNSQKASDQSSRSFGTSSSGGGVQQSDTKAQNDTTNNKSGKLFKNKSGKGFMNLRVYEKSLLGLFLVIITVGGVYFSKKFWKPKLVERKHDSPLQVAEPDGKIGNVNGLLKVRSEEGEFSPEIGINEEIGNAEIGNADWKCRVSTKDFLDKKSFFLIVLVPLLIFIASCCFKKKKLQKESKTFLSLDEVTCKKLFENPKDIFHSLKPQDQAKLGCIMTAVVIASIAVVSFLSLKFTTPASELGYDYRAVKEEFKDAALELLKDNGAEKVFVEKFIRYKVSLKGEVERNDDMKTVFKTDTFYFKREARNSELELFEIKEDAWKEEREKESDLEKFLDGYTNVETNRVYPYMPLEEHSCGFHHAYFYRRALRSLGNEEGKVYTVQYVGIYLLYNS